MLRAMCLIALALNAHPRYRLVLAANRDEFHARPTAPAARWDDAPLIFGGRDLLQGGGWLALHADGRWAAVTNVRRMEPRDPDAPSRGELVAGYLREPLNPAQWADTLAQWAPRYAGFNLLLGDAQGAHYASNAPLYRSAPLAPGIHAVSNASLDTPWPKLLHLKAALARWCAQGEQDPQALFTALADPREAEAFELPDTGVGLERERFLSPAFIRGSEYGTRASTVLCIDHEHRAHFIERRFGPEGVAQGETQQTLALLPA